MSDGWDKLSEIQEMLTKALSYLIESYSSTLDNKGTLFFLNPKSWFDLESKGRIVIDGGIVSLGKEKEYFLKVKVKIVNSQHSLWVKSEGRIADQRFIVETKPGETSWKSFIDLLEHKFGLNSAGSIDYEKELKRKGDEDDV